MTEPLILPEITHLQFAILSIIETGRRTGSAIRDILSPTYKTYSRTKFYQLMSRMEDAGLAVGEYMQVTSNGRKYRERAYEITEEGRDQFRKTLDFYRRFK